MGRAVVLRRREEAGIVRHVHALHECRNELVRRKAAERAVLRRHDHKESSCRRRDEALLGQTVQGELGGIGGNAQRRPDLARRERVAPAGGEVLDVLPRFWTASP